MDIAVNRRKRSWDNTRIILYSGFGGLLLLMALAAIDAIQILKTIQDRNDDIQSEFLAKNRLLNQIRSDLYLSSTYVRDYLLEPETENAFRHRSRLGSTRSDMEAALSTYSKLLSSDEKQPFATLQGSLWQYWNVLRPVQSWDAGDRSLHGYAFLQRQVYPRRAAMLAIADEIANLNERQLQAGHLQVRNLFSRFRIRLFATALATFAVGLLLAGYSVRRILNLETQAESRLKETAQARLELKGLSARLVEAQESERRAISRELHDEVGQSLSALVVGLSNLAAFVPLDRAPEMNEHIASLKSLAETSVGVVRNMSLLLRPSMLDDLGLIPALQWQAREVSRRSGLMVNFSGDDSAEELPEAHKTAVYRVVQEALHNCEKHAHAREVNVSVTRQEDEVMVAVNDDGCGAVAYFDRGLGLRGMRERIENLGGIFRIDSEVGRGTSILARLPMRNGHPANTEVFDG
jgi:signal transduction histidine kinase